MLDLTLRPLKEGLLTPLTAVIPPSITPLHLTLAGFLSGLLSCYFAAIDHVPASLAFWLLNRFLDGLDGTLARQRGIASPLGGFLDLLADFVIYSLIPIACACSGAATAKGGGVAGLGEKGLWLGVSLVEASFHVNNFVLFYAAAVPEGGDGDGDGGGKAKAKKKELTSVVMRPALIEGTESAVLFTLMLLLPDYTGLLCWTMAILVCVGIVQRVRWLIAVL